MSIFQSILNQTPLTITKALNDIVSIHKKHADFWPNSGGWAPDIAFDIMSKARFDRQHSLSVAYKRWFEIPQGEMTDGELILAWANLRSLLEGTLKAFLSVYATDYQKHAFEKGYAETNQSPDAPMLNFLIQFYTSQEIIKPTEIAQCQVIKSRGNSIHAFKDTDIGTRAELEQMTLDYCRLLDHLDSRMPYP